MACRLPLVIVVVVSCRSADAMWMQIPLDRLVKESDAIVVAELTEVREYSYQGRDYGRGVLRVSEILSGDLSGETELALEWSNRENVVCPRISHIRTRGRPGIWLLTFDSNGYVRADYPRRFLELKRRPEITTLIADLNRQDPPRFIPLDDARALARPPPGLPSPDPSNKALREALLGEPSLWSRLERLLRRIGPQNETLRVAIAVMLATVAAFAVAVAGIRVSWRSFSRQADHGSTARPER